MNQSKSSRPAPISFALVLAMSLLARLGRSPPRSDSLESVETSQSRTGKKGNTVKQARDIRNIVLGGVIVASGLSALAATNLTTFAPNTPIKSSEVNANFASLKESVEAPITASRLDTTGTAADGKVLKLEGGKLAWSDDLLGNGGSTYTADGSSLAMSGTIFSVKDGGVTNAKLADKAVTANKLDFPLSVGGTFGTAGLSVQNATGYGLEGLSNSDAGVHGAAESGDGVFGTSSSRNGVLGQSQSGAGVRGSSTSGPGVDGFSVTGAGVIGTSMNGVGVSGSSTADVGVDGFSANSTGVHGKSTAGYAAEFQGGKFGTGICYFAGGSGWSCTSDKNAKENFQAVDTQAVLEALAKMPVTRWNMKGDQFKTPHLGPVAQDFRAAFGLGESDKTISTSDAQGVAFAAIKALYERNQALEARLEALEQAGRSK